MNKFRKIRNSSRADLKKYIENPRRFGFRYGDILKLINIYNKYKQQEDEFLEELCNSNQAQLAIHSVISKKKGKTAVFADLFTELNELTEVSRRTNTFGILKNYFKNGNIIFDNDEEEIKEIILANEEEYKQAKKYVIKQEKLFKEMGDSFFDDKNNYLKMFELDNAIYYYEQAREIDNE